METDIGTKITEESHIQLLIKKIYLLLTKKTANQIK